MVLVCQPITGWCTGLAAVSQAPLPEPGVADGEELDVVVPVVADTTEGTLELVVAGELVDVVCGLPLAVEGAVVFDVVFDASRVAAGSDVAVVVDVLPFVVGVASSEPSDVWLPSVVEVVPELSVAPVEVLAGAGAAGSAMWPTASC
jgi:hypothetical protein